MRITHQYQIAREGDYILNDVTGQTWVAHTCSACGGSGLSTIAPMVVIKCRTCHGTRVEWKLGVAHAS